MIPSGSRRAKAIASEADAQARLVVSQRNLQSAIATAQHQGKVGLASYLANKDDPTLKFVLSATKPEIDAVVQAIRNVYPTYPPERGRVFVSSLGLRASLIPQLLPQAKKNSDSLKQRGDVNAILENNAFFDRMERYLRNNALTEKEELQQQTKLLRDSFRANTNRQTGALVAAQAGIRGQLTAEADRQIAAINAIPPAIAAQGVAFAGEINRVLNAVDNLDDNADMRRQLQAADIARVIAEIARGNVERKEANDALRQMGVINQNMSKGQLQAIALLMNNQFAPASFEPNIPGLPMDPIMWRARVPAEIAEMAEPAPSERKEREEKEQPRMMLDEDAQAQAEWDALFPQVREDNNRRFPQFQSPYASPAPNNQRRPPNVSPLLPNNQRQSPYASPAPNNQRPPQNASPPAGRVYPMVPANASLIQRPYADEEVFMGPIDDSGLRRERNAADAADIVINLQQLPGQGDISQLLDRIAN